MNTLVVVADLITAHLSVGWGDVKPNTWGELPSPEKSKTFLFGLIQQIRAEHLPCTTPGTRH